MGFDRYYGFIGGETNQWYPDLVRDNAFTVSAGYRTTGRFTGGTILAVGVTVEKTQYLNLEKMAAAAFAVD